MNTRKQYKGLDAQSVEQSRKKHGANIITPPSKTPIWKLFIEKFNDPIIKILLIAALLSLGIGFVHNEFTETIGIFAAIILATGLAFWFEYDADKKFDVLNLINDSTPTKVIRDGNVTEIPKKDVVVGDIVVLDTGDEIPADGLLLEAISVQVDESTLTGEPTIAKTTDKKHFNKEATYPSNTLLKGTKILEGNAIYEVEQIGDNTEYGRVARKSLEKSEEKTPLNKQLDGLAKLIGIIGLSFATLTFLSLFIKDIITGTLIFTNTQLYLTATLLMSVMLLIGKVWVPMLSDGLKITTSQKIKIPNAILKLSWIQWVFSGLIFFAIFILIGFLFKINPIAISSWPDIDSATIILKYFMVSVTLIVVTVPEGLPMSVTLSLALNMRRMLKSNNLVRKMHATETLGATTVICTDKTGTLTQNQMQIAETSFFGLDKQKLDKDELSRMIIESIAINSTAHIDFSEPKKPKTIGNPTEAALLLWLNNSDINYFDIRKNLQIIDQISFSTEHKYMASLVWNPVLNKKILYVKGAPEIVLDFCDNVLLESGLTSKEVAQPEIKSLLSTYQSQAMRTLGFAWEIVEDDNPRITNGKLSNYNLTYAGVVAISDPIREDAKEAVATCLNAGISLKIITGDTYGTAAEIGRQIGIIDTNTPKSAIISGIEFEKMSDDEIIQGAKEIKILCRARPMDKQRFVQLLQKSGEIVAVTGDGTNDAPALNFADVGLSMGSGTSVAKEASDITIIDDSFSSIGTAIMWGRSLYQNIQRFIVFQLTINVTAMIIVFVGSIFGHELPLTVTQMLWLNLIMDTFAAGALASLPPNKNVMKVKPRKNSDFIISKKMRTNILFTGFSFVAILFTLLYVFRDNNGNINNYNLSVFFTVFVMMQFWNMFNVKAFMSKRSAFYQLNKSWGFIAVMLSILIGQVLIVQFGGEAFRTVPISITHWLIIIGATSSILWIGELKRAIWA
ncbi:MAG: calcium-translocating P-type ATPase, PMCA-type [Bacteroidales bacterium]|nr:calcium-translocating P-type ATPase, PMCA-type [Bacteroidales bacterium]MDD4216468.1 calcium-translocating P-type ATPase, PMCA-type [Bacteroidales bacterium]MDY0141814.1 calcium-translocating P-type ATPase, PMCA-type [Bacteroidales bacterium]